MREIRLHGSEGGAAETNRSFLPLSNGRQPRNGAAITSSVSSKIPRSAAPAAALSREVNSGPSLAAEFRGQWLANRWNCFGFDHRKPTGVEYRSLI